MRPFDIAFMHATAHGIAAAVVMPSEPDSVPESVLSRLHPEEAEFAKATSGYRTPQYVAGRIAMQTALHHLGAKDQAVLFTLRGAPKLPPGLTGSISHKGNIAMAMVSSSELGNLGIDLEEYTPERMQIAPKVLTPKEMMYVNSLPEDRHWIATLIRFSIKEAIYKALDPFVGRYVGFDEVIVTPDLEGKADVVLQLKQDDGQFHVDARYSWLRGKIFSSVRICKR